MYLHTYSYNCKLLLFYFDVWIVKNVRCVCIVLLKAQCHGIAELHYDTIIYIILPF